MIEKYALFKVFVAIRNSREKLSVRGVASSAGVGVATAKRCCDYLVDQCVLKRKVIGRIHQFSVEEDNVLARHLKIALTLAEIQSARLIDEIIGSYSPVLSVVLFGSTALGKDNPDSDIDILLIVRTPMKIPTLKAETLIKRELSLIVFTAAEWRKKSVTDKVFYDNVIIGGIPLYGEMPAVR